MTKRFNPASITKDTLIKELKLFAKELDRTPSQADMKKSKSAIVKRIHLYRKKFGSIKEAQAAAGLEANLSGSDMKYSEQKL